MDVAYYQKLNDIDVSNILEYPTLHHDPLFKADLIEASIKLSRLDVLKSIFIKKGDISCELCSECNDIDILNFIKPYMNITDYLADELIVNDNINAINVFEIDPFKRLETIEEEVPCKIIKSIMDDERISKDDLFVQAVLIGKYDTCELLIDHVNQSKMLWKNIISSNNSDIVNLCINKFSLPSIIPIDLIKIAIELGHSNFLTKVRSDMYRLKTGILSHLIAKERLDDVIWIYTSFDFIDHLDNDYYIVNSTGYEFFKNIPGFDPEYILLDLINRKLYQIIDKIADEYYIEPSLEYLIKALSGNCKYTLFTVMNRLVTISQIEKSTDFIIALSITERDCFIVYFRICNFLNIKIPNLYVLAIKFDSVEALKLTDYNREIAMKNAMVCGSKRIYKYTYHRTYQVSPTILKASYTALSLDDDISLLHLLINRYGVPKDYENTIGKRGAIIMIEDYRLY